jgi:thiamine-phosphate pyrophosphorylase
LRGLYAITPDTSDTDALLAVAAAVLAGGCRWLQYRNKTADAALRRLQATALADLCRAEAAGLIVNDDIELAQTVGAAGVHLGQDDGDLVAARRRLGPNAILGASCYQDFARARAAVAAGASYVAFGAVYPSPTKPAAGRADRALFVRARAELPVPVCAIGGIRLDNAAPLVAAGAQLIAVISDIFPDIDTPARPHAAIRARAAAYQALFEDTP